MFIAFANLLHISHSGEWAILGSSEKKCELALWYRYWTSPSMKENFPFLLTWTSCLHGEKRKKKAITSPINFPLHVEVQCSCSINSTRHWSHFFDDGQKHDCFLFSSRQRKRTRSLLVEWHFFIGHSDDRCIRRPQIKIIHITQNQKQQLLSAKRIQSSIQKKTISYHVTDCSKEWTSYQ